MVKFKNLYLRASRRNANGEITTYKGFHKNGFVFEIDFYRKVWEPHFEVYNMLDNERIILRESIDSANFKKALKDINDFFNKRTIKWKNYRRNA